jgi:hypothetical protein
MRAFRFVLLCLPLMLVALVSRGQESTAPTEGTLVTAMGNRQGIVVMTDSRASIRDARGQFRPANNPIQKVVEYDEHRVCAIAGLWFGAVRKPSEPNKSILPWLDAQALGIVQSYRDGVKRSGQQQTMAETLAGLSAVIRARFNVQAELNAHLGHTADEITIMYRLELILAGTDTDEQQKIGRIDIAVKREPGPDGQLHWTARENASPCKLTSIKSALFICSAGIESKEQEIRNNPERYTRYPVIRDYVSAIEKDHGASLSLVYLKTLGHLFKALTSAVDDAVGGNDQIATIPKGATVQIDGINGFAPFKKPEPILVVLCAPGAVISGDGGFVGGHLVFESCTFSRFNVYLDGNVYIDCTFRVSVLWYGGGDNTLFEDDNVVEGESYLRRSQGSCRHPEVVEQLVNRFDFEHGGWKGVEDRPQACPSQGRSVSLFPQP